MGSLLGLALEPALRPAPLTWEAARNAIVQDNERAAAAYGLAPVYPWHRLVYDVLLPACFAPDPFDASATGHDEARRLCAKAFRNAVARAREAVELDEHLRALVMARLAWRAMRIIRRVDEAAAMRRNSAPTPAASRALGAGMGARTTLAEIGGAGRRRPGRRKR